MKYRTMVISFEFMNTKENASMKFVLQNLTSFMSYNFSVSSRTIIFVFQEKMNELKFLYCICAFEAA